MDLKSGNYKFIVANPFAYARGKDYARLLPLVIRSPRSPIASDAEDGVLIPQIIPDFRGGSCMIQCSTKISVIICEVCHFGF